MQVSVTRLSSVSLELSILLPVEVVSKKYDEGLAKVAKTAHLKGFRPGKAPRHVVQQMFGPRILSDLANELVNAARAIVGDLPQFVAVSIGEDDDATVARQEIAQAVARVQGSAGALILTDMFGGTPSNLGFTFLETNRVEVITGVNLPMLIKLAQLHGSSDLLAVAREVREAGREAIWVASDLLHADPKV